MDRPRLIRGLRIAWTAFFGVLCVLLVVLWVRSYADGDLIYRVDNSLQRTVMGSNTGCMYLHRMDERPIGPPTNGWVYKSFSPTGFMGFQWTSSVGNLAIHVPFWFLVTVAFSTAVLPWLPRRFSLRTLLIATTLIAVVLGLVVWTTG